MENATLEALMTGDESAFKALFTDYYAPLSHFACRLLRDTETSKDVVQNVFVRMYLNRRNIRIESDLKAYLYRAVYNESLNELKKQKAMVAKQQIYANEIETIDDFDQAVEQTENERKIYLAINKLPPRCKQIFTMSRLDGKRNHEIASALGLSLRTVETQISIALKSLREMLLSAAVWLFHWFL
jgi:RNA polymerase sigma-70 factor, ECF subfamily